MSRIDCGEVSGSVACRCSSFSGCGHLSSWHRVFERWTAKCLVPGCECEIMDACNCVEGLSGGDVETDKAILESVGIATGGRVGVSDANG